MQEESAEPHETVGRRSQDQSGAYLREAAREIAEGLMVIDDEARLILVNDQYCHFFDIDPHLPALQRGQPIADVFRTLAERGVYGPAETKAQIEDHIQKRLLPVRERRGFDLDRALPGGRFVQVSGRPMKGGGYVFTFTDVTERVNETERLDQLVAERTAALADANKKLTDSLQYARMLQSGILPEHHLFQRIFGSHFLHFQPADLVGGDFYVGLETDHGVFFGVGDCTGHGVPGAMMSMMAASVTRRAINEAGDGGPAAVLMAIDRIVRANLHQTEARVGPDNGLELSLCLWEPDAKRMRLASAGLDIFLQHDGEIERIRGTRHGLGYGRETQSTGIVTETVVDATQADRLFMTSDGILDQAGGPKGFGFGRRRLVDSLASHADKPIDAQGHQLIADIQAYRGDYPQRDDLAILGIPVKA